MLLFSVVHSNFTWESLLIFFVDVVDNRSIANWHPMHPELLQVFEREGLKELLKTTDFYERIPSNPSEYHIHTQVSADPLYPLWKVCSFS